VVVTLVDSSGIRHSYGSTLTLPVGETLVTTQANTHVHRAGGASLHIIIRAYLKARPLSSDRSYHSDRPSHISACKQTGEMNI